MKNIKNNVINYIKTGHFKNAQTISFDILPQKDFYDLIIELGFETESISIYTFICFLLMTDEKAYLHQLAATLISQALSHIDGAYSAGLCHIRRAIEIEPHNISYKEYLLLFNAIPEKLLNDQEAEYIAQEILKQDSTNLTALEFIAQFSDKTK